MITLMDVYNAFLGKVNEDDWSHCYSKDDLEWFMKDWRTFLNAALAYFKFPRCSLEINEETQSFKDTNMSQDEVQILATYMKYEWLSRTVDSWENIKTQYDEKDFSLLKSKLLKMRHIQKEFITAREIKNLIIMDILPAAGNDLNE